MNDKMLIRRIQTNLVQTTRPAYLFTVTVFSIFTSEVLVMFILSELKPVSLYRLALLDGSILAAILFPILFFLVFKPMKAHIEHGKEIESSLQKSRDELESKVKDRTAELLKRNSELKLRTEQLGRLSLELTMAEDRERQRIAELLHDDLQQLLVGTKIRLEVLGSSLDPFQKQEIDQALELIIRSIKTTRSLTCELSPSALHYGEFSAALKWLARWMQEKFGLTVEVKSDSRLDPKSESVTVLLFQSVRELLFNVVKHAGTKSACIEMDKDSKEGLRICVRDDGTGFDPADLWKNPDSCSGFGLYAIRERMEFIGGHLAVESAPGKGSTFTLSAPL